MEKQIVTTSAAPHVLLDISGDLSLKGQDSFEVVVKSDNPDNLVLEAQDDQVTIRCPGDCTVRVPRAAIIQVASAHGDAVLKALDGDVTIDATDGDLELRNVGPTKVGKVNGDFEAKNVEGDLNIDSAQGDVSIRGVQGDFTVTNRISGNLNLSDVGGSAKAYANGNIILHLDPAPGHLNE